VAGTTPDELEKRRRALASPWTGRAIKWMARAQVKVFKATGGRVGSRWRIGAGFRKPVPTLLLEHVGRRSGTAYTTPLLYLVDGADLVVVGSQGGRPLDPQWVANLRAHPETTVHLRGERRQVRAHVADPDERERLWPRLVELYADFATYQATTDRVIPVVVLRPA
jgi:F420H(2)-dependent quinone reductase